MTFLPYARQSITRADIEAVGRALKSPIITRGDYVDEFEARIASYCGARFAVAFNSASSALMGACRAVGVNGFDRVISTPNTFIATLGSAMQCGAKPVLVDIDLSSGNIDLHALSEVLQQPYSRGRAIIMPVHFSGIAMDMAELSKSIRDVNAVIIEDAAHALGSHYPDGTKVGSCAESDMTVFSFHPAKTMTTGEGGVVTTNDPEYFRRLRLHRNNGIERDPAYMQQHPFPGYYEVQHLGHNYNMTDFQAALGISQLARIQMMIAKRRAAVGAYRKLLSNTPHVRLFSAEWDRLTAFHLFVVQIDFAAAGVSRKSVMERLYDKEIGTQLHYIPIYHHPVFKQEYGDISGQFPCMEEYFAKALSLPLYSDLTEDDVLRVVQELQGILKG